jgi:hypothetical protein
VSIRTPTPSRFEAPPLFLTNVLDLLSGDGWRVEIVSAPRDERLSFSLVARCGDEPRVRSVVLHGYVAPTEVRLKDVWRVLAHLNDLQGDVAVLCLGVQTSMSALAAETARRLGVEVRRIAG